MGECSSCRYTDESADRLEVDTAPQDTNDFSYVMQMLAKNVTMFVLQTRECHLLPKSTCSSIVNDVSVLFSTFTEHFCDFILSRLESNGIDVSRDATLYNVLVDRSLMDSLWSMLRQMQKLVAIARNIWVLSNQRSYTRNR